MVIVCLQRDALEFHVITPANQSLLKEAIWIDLLSPTSEENELVNQCLQLTIPTHEKMGEIEVSSRLYKENDKIFMTATMIAQSDTPEPKYDSVTFILSQQQLVTIRYIQPQSFDLCIARLKKIADTPISAATIFIELLDSAIDRLADILEMVSQRLDKYSKTIFHTKTDSAAQLNYRQLLQIIGANADLNTKALESLVTFSRLLSFFSQTENLIADDADQQRLAIFSKDILSINDHANFLSMKINFLLDATLGLVSIEQNNIIKIFSVAAVIFLPPTLVASIYGMNFIFIPELAWKYGYLFAIGMIILAAWLPYRYFKYRKWL